eukprot:Awhi_evm2s1030
MSEFGVYLEYKRDTDQFIKWLQSISPDIMKVTSIGTIRNATQFVIQSSTKLPLKIWRSLNNCINLRILMSEKLKSESDHGHEYFNAFLCDIRNQLRDSVTCSMPQKKPRKKFAQPKKKQNNFGPNKSKNVFAALAAKSTDQESIQKDDNDDQGLDTNVNKTEEKDECLESEHQEEEFSMEGEDFFEHNETKFILQLFIFDLEEITEKVVLTWKQYKRKEISLFAATAVNNAAAKLVTSLSSQLQLDYPTLVDFFAIAREYNIIIGVESILSMLPQLGYEKARIVCSKILAIVSDFMSEVSAAADAEQDLKYASYFPLKEYSEELEKQGVYHMIRTVVEETFGNPFEYDCECDDEKDDDIVHGYNQGHNKDDDDIANAVEVKDQCYDKDEDEDEDEDDDDSDEESLTNEKIIELIIQTMANDFCETFCIDEHGQDIFHFSDHLGRENSILKTEEFLLRHLSLIKVGKCWMGCADTVIYDEKREKDYPDICSLKRFYELLFCPWIDSLYLSEAGTGQALFHPNHTRKHFPYSLLIKHLCEGENSIVSTFVQHCIFLTMLAVQGNNDLTKHCIVIGIWWQKLSDIQYNFVTELTNQKNEGNFIGCKSQEILYMDMLSNVHQYGVYELKTVQFFKERLAHAPRANIFKLVYHNPWMSGHVIAKNYFIDNFEIGIAYHCQTFRLIFHLYNAFLIYGFLKPMSLFEEMITLFEKSKNFLWKNCRPMKGSEIMKSYAQAFGIPKNTVTQLSSVFGVNEVFTKSSLKIPTTFRDLDGTLKSTDMCISFDYIIYNDFTKKRDHLLESSSTASTSSTSLVNTPPTTPAAKEREVQTIPDSPVQLDNGVAPELRDVRETTQFYQFFLEKVKIAVESDFNSKHRLVGCDMIGIGQEFQQFLDEILEISSKHYPVEFDSQDPQLYTSFFYVLLFFNSGKEQFQEVAVQMKAAFLVIFEKAKVMDIEKYRIF